MSTQQYVITYGIKQGRGGYLLTEQKIIDAKDSWSANSRACFHCKRGESVLFVEPING